MRRAWVALVMPGLTVAGVALLAMVRYDVETPLRLLLALGFLLLGPGAAVVVHLTLDDNGLAVALAVAVSVVADLFVAQSMVWLSAWSAGGGLTVLVAMTAAGTLGQLARMLTGGRRHFVAAETGP